MICMATPNRATNTTGIATMIELLLPPLFAGLAVALVSGPMGAFVVWRRMAFFGDTLAHGALLGAALGLALDISLYLAVVAVCLGLAAALTALQHQQQLASDTLLGIVAHTTLALVMIAISLQQGIQVDLFAYLFGDLLAVGWQDALALWAGAILILLLMLWQWRALLSITVSEELAQVEGVAVQRTRLLLMLLRALLIAGAGGSAIAADLGARKIREELDAMMVLGIDPIQRLVVPRVLAAMLVAVFLNGLVSVVGVAGGYVFNVVLQDGTPGAYIASFTALAQLPDLWVGLVKATIFGLIAAVVAAYKGMNAAGGPKGVGDAVNESVVITFVLLFIVNFVISAIYLQVVPPKTG